MPKFMTMTSLKGGIGKTTLVNTIGHALANRGFNILLIDLDHQASLTSLYDDQAHEVTSADALQGYTFELPKDLIQSEDTPNIWILPAREFADDEELGLEDEDGLLYWREHQENLDMFDYILADTHPDFGLTTRNAVKASDIILSSVMPGKQEWNAHAKLPERIAKFGFSNKTLGFIGTNFSFNEGDSHAFEEMLQDEEQTVAILRHRAAIASATNRDLSVYQINASPKVLAEVDEQMDKVIAFIDNN